MTGHEILQMLVYAGIGAWALVFGRKTYSRPEMMHDRWLSGSIPRRKWLLRTMAVIWIFIGFIAIGSAVTTVPPIRTHSGVTLLAIVLLLSLIGTVLVLRSTLRDES